MRFDVLSLFPEIINAYSQESIIKNAIEADLIDLNLCNPRDYSLDKHKKVDDTPYGGGAGMLLQIQPYLDCFLETIRQSNTALKDFRIDDFYPEANDRLGFMYPQEREYEVIMFSPRGERFNQEIAQELSTKKHLVMLCGRYEGFDERLRNIVSKEISIGDFVLTGGELPALTVIDAVARLLPSVLGDSHSAVAESFNSALDIFDMDLNLLSKAEKKKLLADLAPYGLTNLDELSKIKLLEYPHYTRPAEFRSLKVPPVLSSGDHKQIALWRLKEAFKLSFPEI